MTEVFEFFRSLVFFAAYISSGASFPPPLTSAEERAALEAFAKGDPDARETLIKHNLRLVAHVSKKYAGAEYDFDDLISIGTIGLIKAISTFDAGKGSTLATYAGKCIQNEILMVMRAGKKRKAEVSLSDPIGKDKEGNEITLADVIGTPAEFVFDSVELELQKSRLKTLLGTYLSPREKLIIELRYGLGASLPQPQREVAKRLGISRSYVSRIEKRALEKLRLKFDKK